MNVKVHRMTSSPYLLGECPPLLQKCLWWGTQTSPETLPCSPTVCVLATHSAEGSLQSHADPQQHKARSSSSPLNAETALRQHAPPKPARLQMLRPGSMVPPLHALAPRASERSGASLLREDGLIWRAGNAERWLAAVNGSVLSGRRSTGVEELAAAWAQEQRGVASEGTGHHCAGAAGLPHGMSGDRGHGGGDSRQIGHTKLARRSVPVPDASHRRSRGNCSLRGSPT